MPNWKLGAKSLFWVFCQNYIYQPLSFGPWNKDRADLWGEWALFESQWVAPLYLKSETESENLHFTLPYCRKGKAKRPKKLFLFILIYVISLSFFFPKWGHTFLTYQNFSFYECLSEGNSSKYRKNQIFWEISFFCI